MTKIFPILALLLATPLLAADEATQVEVRARYEGLDPTYTKFVDPSLKSPTQTDLSLPKITILSGKKGVIRVVRENLVSQKEAKNVGTTLEISPTIDGSRINVAGLSSLCAVASPAGKVSPKISSFKTLDTYFNDTFPNNKEVAIKLSDEIPGTLYLTLTLINKEGRQVQ